MPLQATSGAASYDAFGGGAAAVPQYIEDVFSTYLYTGTGSALTITNGIDLAGSGGLTWIKQRDVASNHLLMTTDGGPTKRLRSNGQPSYVTSAAGTDLASFNSNGFSLGVNNQSDINTSAQTYVSWSLRKQPKFFDVVTWTGNGVAGRTVAHNLGSVPGCIIIGATTALGTNWAVYHNSLANTEYLTLNSTAAKATSTAYWNSTTPTASVFSLGTDDTVNYNTGTYIAYVFAHNAGGFGLTGTDNVISCGSVTANGSGSATVNLGYEPQWLLVKSSSEANGWAIVDTMRGLPADGLDRFLFANSSAAESGGGLVNINATGFYANATLSASATYIYIAIRRGPMKVPTDATKVFSPVARTGTGANATVTAGFTPDVLWYSGRNAYYNRGPVDKLRGVTKYMYFTSTGAEQTFTTEVTALTNTGMTVGDSSGSTDINKIGIPYINWFLQRAPNFFDEVCYTGNGTAGTTQTHNLGVVPEMIILKGRNTTNTDWVVGVNFTPTSSLRIFLNASGEGSDTDYSAGFSFGGQPTSTTFTLGSNYFNSNRSGFNYVAYLFASCPNVSKVFNFTGNGSTQTIDCGFTGGARFVLLKASTVVGGIGGWFVYDTARGMTTLTDPYLQLNTTAAESATLGSVTTVATGFAVNESILAGVNTNGVSYIGLAIA